MWADLIAEAHAMVQAERKKKGLEPWQFEERPPKAPEHVMGVLASLPKRVVGEAERDKLTPYNHTKLYVPEVDMGKVGKYRRVKDGKRTKRG